MGQYAPVMPPQMARAIKQAYGDALLGKYHLLLAHDVAERPEEYKDLYPKDAFIIMDNGVIELGHPVDYDTLRLALNTVRARVIVLPDAIQDAEATIAMSSEFAEEYGDLLDDDQRFLAVPQGNSVSELQDCAIELAKIPRVAAWGVGRFVTKILGTRKGMADFLWNDKRVASIAGGSRFSPFIHMLGFSDDLADDMACVRMAGVMGIDSAAPVRMGQHDLLMKPKNYGHIIRGNWWENEKADSVHASTVANILLVRMWCAQRVV